MFKDADADMTRAEGGASRSIPPTAASLLNAAFHGRDPIERLRLLADNISGTLAFTTSFGLEDQALTHLIVRAGVDVDFVTLDTGRLFPQTYDVWAETEVRYGIRIRAVYPQAAATEALVTNQGINGFRDSLTQRKACCGVRKLEPLQRALKGAAGWITGLRADQTTTRNEMQFVSADPTWGLLKANPLLDWSREKVADLVKTHAVPRNALHSQGFPSIGCAPCTRAVAPGEPERAGRWWWENEGSQECGLHLTAQGRWARNAAER